MVFEKLYYKYHNGIYRFAFKLCLSRSESEDLLQDTFMRLFKELDKGVELENPRAWLYKVVLNLWKNKYNRLKTIQSKSAQVERPGNNDQTPETDFIEREKRKLVFDSLQQLPAKERNILTLYHDGLSYAEIAEVLDMKPESVGTTLSRSIQKFKSQLKVKHHELFEQY